MQRLLDFLYQRRELAVFLSLEILSIWLLVSFNDRYNAAYFNSSNGAAARIASASNDVSNYFKLTEVNAQLMKENEQLKTELMTLRADARSFLDTLGQYEVIGSKVVNNSFLRSLNFVTVAAGKEDGVEVGMGAITPFGIVGQVKSVTDHFATIYSVLHPKLMTSSKVKRTKTIATVQWEQQSYDRASLKYVPRHIDLKVGDTVVTSGFNSVFPEDIPIGLVDEIALEDHMTFYEATVKLTTDFTSLHHVFIIKDLLKQEKDSLIAE